MNRKEFLKKATLLSLGTGFLPTLVASCDKGLDVYPTFDVNFSGKVIVIGAGAAGITAAYLLKRYGIDFQLLEASPNIGGRVKRISGFADFPIDLGAEWLHDDPEVLAELISDTEVDASIDMIRYRPQTLYAWKNNKLKKNNWASNFYAEYKFKNTTWYGFFEQYMLPSIEEQILLNQVVNAIDTSGEKVKISTSTDTFEADRVLLTVPIKMLQQQSITFTPAMPTAKQEAIDSISMPDGIKVFLEFSERFYPDILFIGGFWNEIQNDDLIYYDAAFRKDSTQHVLGLFSVGGKASAYTNLENDEAVIAYVLDQLDEMFEGKASQYFLKAVVQNWSKEPFIQGSYSSSFANSEEETVPILVEPIDNKVFFAGEALSIDNGSTVHGAAQTAYTAIERILKNA